LTASTGQSLRGLPDATLQTHRHRYAHAERVTEADTPIATSVTLSSWTPTPVLLVAILHLVALDSHHTTG
jgi:hypothetical protein